MADPRQRYYRIVADPTCTDRWYLDEPVDVNGCAVDAREFTGALYYRGPALSSIPIQVPGRRVAFNLGAFDMPVVSEEIGRVIKRIAGDDVQQIPAHIDSHIRGYEVLNVLASETCIDENRSEIVKWNDKDGRQDRIGEYRMVTNLTIDPRRVRGKDVFRIAGWEIALIVSSKVVDAIRATPDLGVCFQPV